MLHVAKYDFSGNCEVNRNLMPTDVPETNKIDHVMALDFFLIFGSVLGNYLFSMIVGWPKVGLEYQKTIKGLRGDARDQTEPADPKPRRGAGGGNPPPGLEG